MRGHDGRLDTGLEPIGDALYHDSGERPSCSLCIWQIVRGPHLCLEQSRSIRQFTVLIVAYTIAVFSVKEGCTFQIGGKEISARWLVDVHEWAVNFHLSKKIISVVKELIPRCLNFLHRLAFDRPRML